MIDAPLEREGLLGSLSDAHRSARAGAGRLLLVGGEAGIGKTTLVRAFQARLDRDTTVLTGSCEPLAAPRPLGPLVDVAGELGVELRRASGGDAGRDRVFEATLAALMRPSRPLVLVFEDLHWADEASFDLVRFVGRRITRTRALLIVTYRIDEVGPRHPLRTVIGDLVTAPGVVRLTVPPLSRGAVAQLAGGSRLDPAEVHRITAGNPFFVSAVLEHGVGGVPGTVRDAVTARFARLPEGARAALEAASVLGRRVDPNVLLAMGVEAASVDACIEHGMLVDGGAAVEFRHELAREAVYDLVPLTRRRELHRAALAVLERAAGGADALATLAHHAAGAGDTAAVLRHAPAAGRHAAQLEAHREAFTQFARALPHADALPPQERLELLEAYAVEAGTVDRPDDAIRAWRELADAWQQRGDQRRSGRCLTLLAGQLVGQGDNAGADAAIDAAIERLEAVGAGADLAAAYRYQAHLRMLDRDSDAAVAWGRRALDLAAAAGSVAIRAEAHATIGAALVVGNRPGGREQLERAIELARANDLHAILASAYGNLGSGEGEMHAFETAEQALRQCIAVSEEYQTDHQRIYAQAWLALVRLARGDWLEAGAMAAQVVDRPWSSTIARIMALVALGRLRSRRADPDADSALDEALELALGTLTLQRLAPVRAARAEAAVLVGDLATAAGEAAAAFGMALEHEHPWFVGELGYWLHVAGERIELPAYAAAPYALQVRGEALAAAAAWDALGCPYEAARARSESTDEAALRDAHDRLVELGATAAAALVAQRMRRLGVRGVPRGPQPRTAAHPAGLTPREAAVLGLLAEGLRNADIARRHGVTPKTVAHQVSSILSKLGARSRTEAVAEAARLGIVDRLHQSGRHPDGYTSDDA